MFDAPRGFERDTREQNGVEYFIDYVPRDICLKCDRDSSHDILGILLIFSLGLPRNELAFGVYEALCLLLDMISSLF